MSVLTVGPAIEPLAQALSGETLGIFNNAQEAVQLDWSYRKQFDGDGMPTLRDRILAGDFYPSTYIRVPN